MYRVSWLDPGTGECIGFIDFIDEGVAVDVCNLIDEHGAASDASIEEV